MSIAYGLLGIPKTFDEFVDKAKQRGQALNIIFYKSFYEPKASTTMDYYNTCFELRLGRRTLKLKELLHYLPILPKEAQTASHKHNQKDLEEAIEIAEDLQSRGVKTTINRKSFIKQ